MNRICIQTIQVLEELKLGWSTEEDKWVLQGCKYCLMPPPNFFHFRCQVENVYRFPFTSKHSDLLLVALGSGEWEVSIPFSCNPEELFPRHILTWHVNIAHIEMELE